MRRHRQGSTGTMRRAKGASLLAAAMVAAVATPAPAAGCEPATLALDHPAGYPLGQVLAFGPRGTLGGTAEREVAGRYEQVAVLWRDGEPSLVGDVPQSYVADINDRGDVLITGGEWPDGRAAVLARGVARYLPSLYPEGAVYGARLNDRGDVAGAAIPEEGAPEVPVVWRKGREPEVLALPAGAEAGVAHGINDRGDVVGVVFGPDMFSAWMWHRDGSHEPLPLGTWPSGDPGVGIARVIDESGRIGGNTGPMHAPGAAATIWTTKGRQATALDDGWAQLLAGNDHGDFAGEAFDTPEREGVPQAILMSVGADPLTLVPLSGDVEDEGVAHAVSGPRQGDVTVGGSSTAPGGDGPVATLWRCAGAQGVPFGDAN